MRLIAQVEEVEKLTAPYDSDTGLPPFLQDSIRAMSHAWKKIDNGEEYLHWDCDYCELRSDINSAEVTQVISSEQAWYLREKYLRMKRV